MIEFQNGQKDAGDANLGIQDQDEIQDSWQQPHIF
jgi:hypothetical protein